MDEAGISKRVTALMAQHGIKKHKFSAELQRILGVTPSVAFKKIRDSFWSIDQVAAVAAAYGEDPRVLLTGDKEQNVSRAENAATFIVVESARIPCKAKIGDELKAHNLPPDHLVACRESSGWCIYQNKNAPTGIRLFEVDSIEVRQQSGERMIAVLDDEEEVANNLCDYLCDHGFTALAYYTTESLQEAEQQISFDGYVLDWLLDEATAEVDIVRIRSQKADIPIVVLTGKLNMGTVSESDIANVVEQFSVAHFEKPIRFPILRAALSQAIQGVNKNII